MGICWKLNLGYSTLRCIVLLLHWVGSLEACYLFSIFSCLFNNLYWSPSHPITALSSLLQLLPSSSSSPSLALYQCFLLILFICVLTLACDLDPESSLSILTLTLNLKARHCFTFILSPCVYFLFFKVLLHRQIISLCTHCLWGRKAKWSSDRKWKWRFFLRHLRMNYFMVPSPRQASKGLFFKQFYCMFTLHK